jgi:hypothetical protein
MGGFAAHNVVCGPGPASGDIAGIESRRLRERVPTIGAGYCASKRVPYTVIARRP